MRGVTPSTQQGSGVRRSSLQYRLIDHNVQSQRLAAPQRCYCHGEVGGFLLGRKPLGCCCLQGLVRPQLGLGHRFGISWKVRMCVPKTWHGGALRGTSAEPPCHMWETEALNGELEMAPRSQDKPQGMAVFPTTQHICARIVCCFCSNSHISFIGGFFGEASWWGSAV